jgi:hypothetical protein
VLNQFPKLPHAREDVHVEEVGKEGRAAVAIEIHQQHIVAV